MRITAVTCGIAVPGAPFERIDATSTRYGPSSSGSEGVEGIASTDCPSAGWWRTRLA